MDLNVIKGIIPFDDDLSAKDDQDDPTINNLPRGVFKRNREEDDQLAATHLEEVIGEDNYKAVCRLAKGQNLRPLPFLRQEIYRAITDGRFDAELADDEKLTNDIKRTSKDDGKNESNKLLQKMFGQQVFGLLVFSARSCKLSNIATLRRGLAKAIDTAKVLNDIAICEQAQAELEKNRTASVALNNILGR